MLRKSKPLGDSEAQTYYFFSSSINFSSPAISRAFLFGSLMMASNSASNPFESKTPSIASNFFNTWSKSVGFDLANGAFEVAREEIIDAKDFFNTALNKVETECGCDLPADPIIAKRKPSKKRKPKP